MERRELTQNFKVVPLVIGYMVQSWIILEICLVYFNLEKKGLKVQFLYSVIDIYFNVDGNKLNYFSLVGLLQNVRQLRKIILNLFSC